MVGTHVVIFGDVLSTEAAVRGRVVELECLDDAALHGRQDFRPRKLGNARAHGLEHVRGETDRAIFHAFEVFRPLELLLEPAQRLRRHGEGKESNDVEPEDLLHQLIVKCLTTAVVDPSEQLTAVEPVGRAGAEQRSRAMLAVPIGRDRMRAVEYAGMDAVLHRERLHHGAGVEVVDLQPGAGHVVDFGHVILGEIVENVLRTPGPLHLQYCGLSPRHLRHCDRGGAGRARRQVRTSDVSPWFCRIVLSSSCPPIWMVARSACGLYCVNKAHEVIFHGFLAGGR